MGLNKRQIIEIQEAAKFNYTKRLREAQEEKELEEAVSKRLEESKASRKSKTVEKKGK